MKYTSAQISLIIELKNDGYSSRQIANIVGGSKSGVNELLNRLTNSGPRVLMFDLENAPSVAAAFQRFNVNLTPSHIIQEGGWLISASWKWLGKEKIEGSVLTPSEALAQDDSRIVQEMADQFEQADFVVAHNGKRFDVPLLRARILKNKLRPMKTVRVIDTLIIARSMKFESNKLDSLCNYLDIGRKIETTGIGLWMRCMNGDKKSLADMLKYNKQDVSLLEELYLELRPFDRTGPNYGQYYSDDKMHCPACGSTDLESTNNRVYTNVSQFQEYVCNDCGHRSRTRGSVNSKQQRANLLMRAG